MMAALDHKLQADEVLDQFRGPVMELAGPIINELAPILDELDADEQDDVIAGEIAEKLDALITLPEPFESLDRPVFWLVARGAIAMWRNIQTFQANLGGRIDKWEDKLEDQGAEWSSARRKRTARRIARMKKRLARRSG
jgi:hypothetical protein